MTVIDICQLGAFYSYFEKGEKARKTRVGIKNLAKCCCKTSDNNGGNNVINIFIVMTMAKLK
jgi:hypothetical protein